MSEDVLLVRRESDTTEFVLNRPDKGNALSDSLVAKISDQFDRALSDGTRLFVFRGAGKHFCTGFDLSDLDAESDATLSTRLIKIELLLQKIYSAPVPTLAIGSGRCFGAGADLFAACDRRIAVEGSTYAFPGPSFGLVLGTARLAQRIGRDRAREVLLNGTVLSAADAVATGFATQTTTLAETASLIEAAQFGARRLEARTISALFDATNQANDDRDLAALVRSSSVPGLKARISAYVASINRRR